MSNTDNLTISLLFVLSLNLVMFFVSHGLVEVGATDPFADSDNMLNKFSSGNLTNPSIPTNLTNYLPDTQAVGVDPQNSNVFTDLFTSVRSWILDKTGIGWILGIMDAPKVILVAIGLSPAMAWALTALWYGITLLFIVAFIVGR